MTAIPLFPRHVDPPYSGRGRRPRAQARVLAMVRAHGPVDAGTLAAEFGRSAGGVRRCLRLLESAALVVGEAGDGRARVWRAAE